MNKVKFLTMVGCHNCAAVKAVFDEIMPEFKDSVEVEEIDMLSDEGQALVQKYSVFASPGIIINDELFSTGGVDRDKLVEKLSSLTE